MLTSEGRAIEALWSKRATTYKGANRMDLTGDPDEVYDAPGVVLIGDTLVSFWVRQVRDLYLSTLDMEVDEFEALIAVALTGHRPDDDRVCAYAPLDEGIGTKGQWG